MKINLNAGKNCVPSLKHHLCIRVEKPVKIHESCVYYDNDKSLAKHFLTW